MKNASFETTFYRMFFPASVKKPQEPLDYRDYQSFSMESCFKQSRIKIFHTITKPPIKKYFDSSNSSKLNN